MKRWLVGGLMMVALASRSAAASEAGEAPPSWVLAPDPGGAQADANPSAPEKKSFGFKVFNSGLKSICQAAGDALKAPVSEGSSQSAGEGLRFNEGIHAALGRSLARYPGGDFALVDQADLGAEFALGDWQGATPVPGESLGLSISVHSAVKGMSLVVRPLHERESCRGLVKELDLLKYRTVLPLTARRVRGMQVGELWKLSQELSIGIGLSGGAGAGLPGAATAGLTLSFSGMRDRTVLASLYRLDANTLRFRLHLDRVRVESVGGDVSATFLRLPDIGTPLGDEVLAGMLPSFLAKAAGKAAGGAVAHALNQYLYASLGVSRAVTRDNKLVLEYLVDLNDPRQVDGLIGALKGNLELLKLLRTSVEDTYSMKFDDSAAEKLLDREESLATERLERGPSYSGGSASLSRAENLKLHLPLVVDFDGSQSEEDQRLFSVDKSSGEYRSYSAQRQSDALYASVPIFGHLVARHDQRELRAVTYYDGAGRGLPPQAVYVRQWGFTRATGNDIRGQLERINSIMRYSGTRGRGVDSRLEIPVPPEISDHSGLAYDKGTLAFTLVLGQKALQEIESATPREILDAYANVLPEAAKTAFAAAMRYVGVNDDGVTIDQAVYDLPADPLLGSSPAAVVANMARLLVRNVLRLRRARSEADRARALRDLYNDHGRPGHSPETIMKVLVQLADPGLIAAELNVNFVKRIEDDPVKYVTGKGKISENKRYLFNGDRFSNPVLDDYDQRRSRFAQPSTVSD